MLPNFLIIGAMKAGTTALFRYLSDHPQVFMAPDKELNFFVNGQPWCNWARGPEWYEQQFDERRDEVATGEASPMYTKHPRYSGVPARIKTVIPEARLIYVVRHPIERVRSHYIHRALNGREVHPIDKALLEDSRYIEASRYAYQIDQYLEHFPRERLLVIVSEELRERRAATMRKVFGFLGVDDAWEASVLQQEFHRTPDKRVRRPIAQTVRRVPGVRALTRFAPRSLKELDRRLTIRQTMPKSVSISGDLRAHLELLFRDDVRQLRSYVGDHFDGWGIG
jgi:hypothetical protein